MASFNHVVLLGRLTRDPELRYTAQGSAVAELGLAVNRRYNRKDGEQVDEVVFVDVTLWSRLAEVSAEFLKKGREVLVSGHLAQDRWQDEATGQKRSKLRVVGDVLQFLGGGGSKDDAATPAEPEPAAAPEPAEPAPNPAPPKGKGGSKVAGPRHP